MKRACLGFLVLAACGDSTEAPPPVAGVDVEAGPCGHALVVLNSDYQSSSVAIMGFDGEVLARSIVSSGSETTGLSVPLSKDVVVPTARTHEGAILLVDREQSVITVLDPINATVSAQLLVSTGFNANPQDAFEASPGKLYVSRYGANASAGEEPFDAGSDVLVLDRATGDIMARIDLAGVLAGAPANIFPNPSRMVGDDGHVFLLLSAFSKNFAESDDGRVAVIDPTSDTIASFVVVDGMRGCSGLALSPAGTQLAVGCSGTWGGDEVPTLEDSGVVLFDIAEDGTLSGSARFPAVDIGDPISFSLSFASEDALLLATFGRTDNKNQQERPDRLLSLDLASGTATELAATATTPFSIGEVHCAAACGVCFAADAESLAVLELPIDAGHASTGEVIPIDDGIGLPPRFLSAY